MDSNIEEKSFISNNSEDLFINLEKSLKNNQNFEKDFLKKKKNITPKKKDIDLKELKKEKNRISARKSRNKKNLDIQMLVRENKRLIQENIDLKKKINSIKNDLHLLCNNCQSIIKLDFSSKDKAIFKIFKES